MSNLQTSPTGKTRVIKSLAIAGFIGCIIFIAWLAMQLVHVVPGAFASLASLAEGVRQYQSGAPSTTGTGENLNNKGDGITSLATSTIALSADTRTIKAGDTTTVRWGTTETPGTYTFRYTCVEGVAIDLKGVAGITSIACDTNYNLGNVDSLTLQVDSEKERFADISYEIAFLRTADTEPSARGTQTIAVVNQNISEFPTTTPDTKVVVTDPTVTTPGQPVTSNTNRPYEQEFIYAIPSSDPNGVTDLAVRFLNVGKITNNTFSISALSRGSAGAIQFEVKNNGTKTSRSWTYSAILPGSTFESTAQVALKPNERAIITLGFPETDVRSHQFIVTTKETTDRNLSNNRFTQEVALR